MADYHPISAKDQARLHQFEKEIFPGIFVCLAQYAAESGKETFWSQMLRENAEEVLLPRNGEDFIFFFRR